MRTVIDRSRHITPTSAPYGQFNPAPRGSPVITKLNRSMPVTLVASLIEPKSLEPTEPSYDRVRNFESLADMPYNHPIEISLSETVSVSCPRCVNRPPVSVSWWRLDEKGFAQDGFKEACAACKKPFTKATIGIRRLCDELALRRSGTSIAFSSVPPVHTPSSPLQLTFMAGKLYWTLSPEG